jgi:hypothetical protein
MQVGKYKIFQMNVQKFSASGKCVCQTIYTITALAFFWPHELSNGEQKYL